MFVFRPLARAFGFVVSHVFALGAGMSISVSGFAFTPRPLSPLVPRRRARRVSRLPVPGRNLVLMRCPVGFLLAQDPVARFRKMPCHSYNGAAMSALGQEPLIEATDVRVAMSLEAHGAIRRFDKSPFQVLIHEARDTTEAGVTSAGKYPGHKSRVAG